MAPKGETTGERRAAAAGFAASPWGVLAATTAVQALISMAALTPPVFAAVATAEVGLPATLVGSYTSLVYFGAMVTSLLSGSVVGRFGAMRVSQVCLLLCAGGLVLLSAMQAGALVALAVVGALVVGFGYGPVTPASSHILARSTPPERRGLVFSIKQTGVPIGGMLAGALVPPLVLWSDWRGAALAVAAAAAVLAVVVQPTRPSLDADREPGRSLRAAGLLGPLRLIWRHGPLRLISCASFTFAAMQLSLASFLVTYLVSEVGLSLVDAGLVLAVAQGAGIVGRVAWGLLADAWFGPRATLVGLAVVMAAAALVAGWLFPVLPLWLIVVTCALFGATAIGWNGVFLAEVAHLAPEGRAGEATGGALFFTFGGVVCGPSLFGVAVETLPGGYGAAFTVFAAAALAGAVLSLLAARAQREETQP
ncbi:MFS transporter [Caenispirillum bisanense]|uniref:Sugar phosphate permease n=1 Tax=Caenispirillum bisanense TaxID=414052 RepID=A0A286GMQ6_9PROT|nr:MFS transporter [Caenispirillum bisanense]SOD96831.1 Sugar phosphate permease [Caenispirillum bisanense]